jgi:S1-C subfamily serine protease
VNVLKDGKIRGNGSGWVLDAKEGLIATNSHVAEAGNEFEIIINNKKMKAEVFAAASCEDIAIMKVEAKDLSQVKIAPQNRMKIGDKVVTMGYPGNASEKSVLQATEGIISSVKITYGQDQPNMRPLSNLIQTDAKINSGNSGGPLFDSRGELAGMNTLGSLTDQNYAIASDQIVKVTEKLRKKGGKGSGFGTSYGVSGMKLLFPMEKADFQDVDLPVIKGGILALPLSEAAKDELGDTNPLAIIAIDGEETDGTFKDYCSKLADKKSGEEVTYTMTDGKSKKDFTIPLS